MFGSRPLGGALVLFCILAAASPLASAQPAIGDLTGYWTRGAPSQSWFREPADGLPGPVVNLTRPEVDPNAGGGTGTTYIGDNTNPILQPWAADEVLRRADLARAGTPEASAQEVCEPHGVPYILQLNDSVQFLQTPDLFVILYAREMRPRIIHMNAEHPADVGHSSYGHSVGHWEGDTLVVDTIGFTDDTWTDRLGTPHSEKLHTVERYRKSEDGTIRVDFMVEDPGAFTTPWYSWVPYRHDNSAYGYVEQVCAENNIDVYTGVESDIPRDDTPDF